MRVHFAAFPSSLFVPSVRSAVSPAASPTTRATSRTVSRAATLAVVLSAALTLSACGGSDSSESSQGTQATSENQSTATGAPTLPPGVAPANVEELAAVAAGKMVATPITTWDSAVAAVDAGVRHLFVGTGSDFSILNGQGDPARSLAALQDRAGEPLTVSVDEEGGVVQRLSKIIGPLPSARDMAKTMSAQQIREMMADHGRKMKNLGITVDFAPVVDLDSGKTVEENAIGDRAFSPDPWVVADYAQAYAQGLLDAGITPVVKHFPGHGFATGDSHMGAVDVPPLDQLDGRDLIPFARLVGTPGVQVMVGHMHVPGLGTPEEQQLPASVNPAAYRLLRQGGYSAAAGVQAPAFQGTIVTDDLSGMAAVADRYSAADSVVAAIVAGADVAVAASGEVEIAAVVDAVRNAIIDGRITVERAQAALDSTV